MLLEIDRLTVNIPFFFRTSHQLGLFSTLAWFRIWASVAVAHVQTAL